MRLPEELAAAIQCEVEKVDRAALARASFGLAQQYQAAAFSSPVIASEAHRAAYLAARLPATYGANKRVFSEVQRLAPEVEITSVLDLGAGPGTALWAAAETFPALQHSTLFESDQAWIDMGQRIARASSHSVVTEAQWVHCDLRTEFNCGAHDLVVISYALGELPQTAAAMLLRKAWNWARKFLVIIEPGTVRGFALVHTMRSMLLGQQAQILAPCPHGDSCPMFAAGDWCHFSQRVERTSLHRQLKGGSLAYEDEKFSYIVASRQNRPIDGCRIVRHPQKRAGHVQLTLCTQRGIESRTLARSQKQDYKRARQAEWGELWQG